jgi:hypothetical protein
MSKIYGDRQFFNFFGVVGEYAKVLLALSLYAECSRFWNQVETTQLPHKVV